MQVLQLLGKLGARNRRWLKQPQEVVYRENPEHGLRAILMFSPDHQGFLFPQERLLSLMRKLVDKTDAGAAIPWPACSLSHNTVIAGGTLPETAVRFASY